MSRKPRFNLPQIPQHIIQRGNNREPCFYSVEDYQYYLQILSEVASINECEIHAYVLMTNHVHILATPKQPYVISYMMQDLGRKFVRYMNKKHERTGTLWEGRYKSSLIETDSYLLTCMRYIEMNPVRAEMVKAPAEYQWSSYASNTSNKKSHLITPHPLYIELGDSDEQRERRYRLLFEGCLSQADMKSIRNALNQELVLGREDFKNKIAEVTNRQTRPGKDGRPRKTCN